MVLNCIKAEGRLQQTDIMVNESIEPSFTRMDELFEHLEREIPDLSVRMSTHMLRRMIEYCHRELTKRMTLNPCRNTIEVFCEMKKLIRALASANSDSHAGRMCNSIFDGMDRVDTDALKYFSEQENVAFEFFLPILLEMYESVKAGFLAMAQDNAFIVCMGPNGKNRLIDLASVIQSIIDHISYVNYSPPPQIFYK